MKLLSTVSSDQEAWGCDYALIDLSSELATLALRRVNIFKAQKQADQQLGRVGTGHCCTVPPSEPYVRLSSHTAQASAKPRLSGAGSPPTARL